MKRIRVERVAFALCLVGTFVGAGWALATFDASATELGLAVVIALMPGAAAWFAAGTPAPRDRRLEWAREVLESDEDRAPMSELLRAEIDELDRSWSAWTLDATRARAEANLARQRGDREEFERHGLALRDAMSVADRLEATREVLNGFHESLTHERVAGPYVSRRTAESTPIKPDERFEQDLLRDLAFA
jgi:hypothetical protein